MNMNQNYGPPDPPRVNMWIWNRDKEIFLGSSLWDTPVNLSRFVLGVIFWKLCSWIWVANQLRGHILKSSTFLDRISMGPFCRCKLWLDSLDFYLLRVLVLKLWITPSVKVSHDTDWHMACCGSDAGFPNVADLKLKLISTAVRNGMWGLTMYHPLNHEF